MADVDVARISDESFRVMVTEGRSSTEHTVSVEQAYVARLGGDATAEELVEASFRFLLDRESKESILSRFDLPVISRYFPEYEARIVEYLP